MGGIDGGYPRAYLYKEPAGGWGRPVAKPQTLSSPAKDGCLDQVAASATTIILDAVCDNQAFVYSPTVPKISKLKISPKKWHLGKKATKTNFSHRPHGGTVISFTLNEPATVTVKFGSHGSLKVAGRKGKNKVWFDGKLTKHHKLKHGKYRVSASASNVAGHSKASANPKTVVETPKH
jgi:hypothetical protein